MSRGNVRIQSHTSESLCKGNVFIKLIFCCCFDETKLHLNAFNHISKRINCDVVVNPLFMNSNSNMNEPSLGNSNLFVSFT